jgi:RNA 2',3'-cyclic 3'-phosphodiesterase
MSHRLFVAARPPASIRALLLNAMGAVAGARWQDEDQLHITLRFIGDVDTATANSAAEALSGVSGQSFEAAISGVGMFEAKHGSALWAGVTNRAAFAALHKKFDQALIRAGHSAEHRAYHPHVTLARLGRHHGDIGPWLSRESTLSSPDFPVDRFGLYESTLTREGARYELIAEWSLG